MDRQAKKGKFTRPTSKAPTRYTNAEENSQETSHQSVCLFLVSVRLLGLNIEPTAYSNITLVTSGSTSGPGWEVEGDVTFREEQQDAGGHGTERKPIGPTITEAAYSVQRPGAQ